MVSNKEKGGLGDSLRRSVGALVLAGSEESGVGAGDAWVQSALDGPLAFKVRQASRAAEE